jgi:hypothetical protein
MDVRQALWRAMSLATAVCHRRPHTNSTPLVGNGFSSATHTAGAASSAGAG